MVAPQSSSIDQAAILDPSAEPIEGKMKELSSPNDQPQVQRIKSAKEPTSNDALSPTPLVKQSS